MDGKYISYLRVSTTRQGESGLGLAAQRQAVETFLNGGQWQLVGEYVEVESGKVNARPALAKAIAACKLTRATLVVAKLDRLARNTRFLLQVADEIGDEPGVLFCDLPQMPRGPVGRFMLTQMAAVAELEAGLISQRTKSALAQAKAAGKQLGGYRGGPVVDGRLGGAAVAEQSRAFAEAVKPVVDELRQEGLSLHQIAAELARRGIRTVRGGQWSAATVSNLLKRNG